MKKFQFRLQPLLDLRQMEEDRKKRALAELLRDIHQQQQQALDIADEIRREGDILKNRCRVGAVDLNWTSYYYRYVSLRRQAIARCIDHVQNTQKKVNLARRELAHAARQTRMLQRLKEKKQQRWEKDIQRRETNEQNDVAARMFLHNRFSQDDMNPSDQSDLNL